MLIPIIAWVFTIVCVVLAVFFIVRAYRGFKQLNSDSEIRGVIAMQEAANLAKDAQAKRAAEGPRTYLDDDGIIPDTIPDKD